MDYIKTYIDFNANDAHARINKLGQKILRWEERKAKGLRNSASESEKEGWEQEVEILRDRIAANI